MGQVSFTILQNSGTPNLSTSNINFSNYKIMSKNSLIKDFSKSFKPEVKFVLKKIDLKEVKQPIGNFTNRVRSEELIERKRASIEFKKE